MLFGHQDNANQPVAPAATVPQATDDNTSVNPLAVDPQTGASLPVVPPDSPGPVDTTDEQSVLDQGPAVVPDNVSDTGNTGIASFDAPAMDDPSVTDPNPSSPFSAAPAPAPEPEQVVDQAPASLDAPANQSFDAPADNAGEQMMEAPAAPVFAPTQAAPVMDTPSPIAPAPAAVATPDNNLLLDLKQQAITQLSPLVAHLDQTPEENFRTTMMLIQSTDNSALLQQAYASAQAIPDDKVRAQALLDIVNEINYFTQQSNNE